MKLQEKESTNYVEFHTELHTEYEKLNKIKKRDFSLNFFSAQVLLRIYTSASASNEASPSPASPDRSPRVVLRLGSGGVVYPLRPEGPPPPRPLRKTV